MSQHVLDVPCETIYAFHIEVLERDADDRISVSFRLKTGISFDLQTFEPIVTLVFDVEESIDHAHVECLSESSRSGEEKHPGPSVVKNLPNHRGLVYIVAIRITNIFEILVSDGEALHAGILVWFG